MLIVVVDTIAAYVGGLNSPSCLDWCKVFSSHLVLF